MLVFMAGKVGFDASVLANLNSFKRELAFLAAGGVLAYAGGGRLFAVRLPIPSDWQRMLNRRGMAQTN